MNEQDRNFSLIIYYLADRFGNNGVENGRMVNFLRLMNEQELVTISGELTQETTRLSHEIQDDLSRRGFIERVPGTRSGGPSGDRGWRQITDAGRTEARALLNRI